MGPYEPLWLETKYLDNVLKGNITPLDNILKKEIFDENFELGSAKFDDNIIYRTSKPGNITGITLSYSRRLKPKKDDFNHYEDVIEEIDFFKDGNHSIFVKGDWLVRLRFLEKDMNKFRKLLFKTRDRVNTPKKIISIDPVILKDEVRAEFRGSPDIKHEIYFAYKVLSDFLKVYK